MIDIVGYLRLSYWISELAAYRDVIFAASAPSPGLAHAMHFPHYFYLRCAGQVSFAQYLLSCFCHLPLLK